MSEPSETGGRGKCGFGRDASWQDFAAAPARGMASDEEALRRKFWRKLWREAASLPFAEHLLTAHYCAFDRQYAALRQSVLSARFVYFVVPDRSDPQISSLIGFADDAAVLAAAIKPVSSHITPEHREAARRTLARLRGDQPSRP